MTISELKLHLKDLPNEMEVVFNRCALGVNEFYPIHTAIIGGNEREALEQEYLILLNLGL